MRFAAVLVGIGLVAVPALAGAAEAPLPVRVDTYACQSACPGDRSPVWSPDGKRIAFLRYLDTGPQGGSRHLALFTIEPHGAGATLIHDPAAGDAAAVVWSPDSTRLAYWAEGRVWVAPLTGAPPRALPDEGVWLAPYGSVQWSPDGTRLAFVRVKSTGYRLPTLCCELWVAAADGSGSRLVAGSFDGEWAAQPVWAPDGRLTFMTGPHGREFSDPATIQVAKADGSGRRTLATTGSLGYVTLLGWAVDGSRLFLTRWRDRPELETVDQSGAASRIMAFASTSVCCRISPDGRAAAFIHRRPDGEELRALDLATGADRFIAWSLSPQARAALSLPSWSPDGSEIAYLADGECATLIAVYIAATDGSRARRVTKPCRTIGTPRPDAIHRVAGPDAIFARGGRDLVHAGRGPDYVEGGDGPDTLFGDDGDDRLIGGRGKDRLVGGTGWDRVYARDGARDVIECGSGRDGVRADRSDRVARDCEVVQRS